MILSLIISEQKEPLITRYRDYKGLFVQEDGTLCCKPEKESCKCFDLTGKEFEYKGEPVYRAYFEGGLSKLRHLSGDKKGTFDDSVRKVHPSYGLISFSRCTCSSPQALFGSSIKHANPIRMTISHAKVDRHINHDWYHDDGNIVEVEMSQSQFAEAITSLNMGVGVPCTITFSERDGKIKPCDFENKAEQFEHEFAEKIAGASDGLDEAIKEISELFENRKSLRKSDKEKILKALQKAKMDVSSNAEYILSSFNEQMDKSVHEAKGEIESFMQNQITKFANNGMIEQTKNSQRLEIGKISNPIEFE